MPTSLDNFHISEGFESVQIVCASDSISRRVRLQALVCALMHELFCVLSLSGMGDPIHIRNELKGCTVSSDGYFFIDARMLESTR